MSEEEMTAFNELINGFEIVGSLTPEGTAFIKRGVQHLQQENKQLKEVIEEVSKIVENNFLESRVEDFVCLKTTEYKNLKKILDKVKENK